MLLSKSSESCYLRKLDPVRHPVSLKAALHQTQKGSQHSRLRLVRSFPNHYSHSYCLPFFFSVSPQYASSLSLSHSLNLRVEQSNVVAIIIWTQRCRLFGYETGRTRLCLPLDYLLVLKTSSFPPPLLRWLPRWIFPGISCSKILADLCHHIIPIAPWLTVVCGHSWIFFFLLTTPSVVGLFSIMSGRERERERERPSRAQQQASARTNEYFVPKDGIDREVITADICRYLGNDALVRPGTYEVLLQSDSMGLLKRLLTDSLAEPANPTSPARLLYHRIPKPYHRNIAPLMHNGRYSLIISATGHDCRSQGGFRKMGS
jgi:hypothetical protein